MLIISANGSSYAGLPVKLYRYSKDPGAKFVLIGDEAGGLLISGEQIQELYKLLEPFVHPDSE